MHAQEAVSKAYTGGVTDKQPGAMGSIVLGHECIDPTSVTRDIPAGLVVMSGV